MTTSRRDFLKFVVAGSVAAGCPVDQSLLAAPDDSKAQVDGDHYEICHQVRDGRNFARPPVTKRCDVAIIGGGASGLAAAYFLQSLDFMLLEKEPHWGGNATLGEYQGQSYSTGSAFDYKDSASDRLARELGLTPLPINSPDPTIVNNTWVPDTWGAGLDQLPYPQSVRDSFKKFRAEMLLLASDKNQEQFDNFPLTKYLKSYAPEIKQWWDAYGLSNYGAKSVDTSTMIALTEMKDLAGYAQRDPRVTLPGGNGVFVKKLADTVLAKHSDRMFTDSTIVAVEPQKSEVRITYVQAGALRSLAAKFVIMATPKFITARIVSGLSDDQIDAMRQFRFCPEEVINMVFEKPIYTRAYDTWCPGCTFTDMVPADWVYLSQPGYQQKNNILTFYTPVSELDRNNLLKIEGCRQIAANVLRDFHKLLPEFKAEPLEVHFYRRGHAIFVSAPGIATKVMPLASKPLERVSFANTDSAATESVIFGAVEGARRSADWVTKRLAGFTPRAAAEQALG